MLSDLVAPLRSDPSGSVLLFDFDGTLAPIVDSPLAARPASGVVDLLDQLAAKYRLVAAVSGRPVDFLAEHLPASIALSGLYGLESRIDGLREVRPGVERWRPVVARAAAQAEAAAIHGVIVERKGLSVTLHFRLRSQAAAAVTGLATELATATGLDLRPAKMSVELHPPVAVDKGVVVRELAVGARAVLYAGDDLGDLPAFAALGELRAAGVTAVGIAVETSELPAELRSVADALVVGPTGAIDLLRALAP